MDEYLRKKNCVIASQFFSLQVMYGVAYLPQMS